MVGSGYKAGDRLVVLYDFAEDPSAHRALKPIIKKKRCPPSATKSPLRVLCSADATCLQVIAVHPSTALPSTIASLYA
jgi:hypothetical protein